MGPDQQGEPQVGCVPHGPRRGPAATGLALLVLGLAACGPGAGTGAASTSASASPSQSPTTSPTPFDVVSAFVGKMANGLQARSTVSGSLDLGTVHGTIDGSYTFGANGAYEYELTTRIGESRSDESGVSVDGESYIKQDFGPWLRRPAAPPSANPSPQDSANAWGDLASLRDTGMVQRGGTEVHALQAPGGLQVPASRLGISDPSMRDTRATVDFYALDDGTPAGMTMTVTWHQGAEPASVVDGRMVMDLVFTPGSGSVTVTAPDDVWTTFTSKQARYSVAHPAEWTVTPKAGDDMILSPDASSEVEVVTGTTNMSQKQWNEVVVRGTTEWLKARSDGAFTTVVGGVTVQAREYHAIVDKEPTFVVDLGVIHGGFGYEIVWYSIPGYESDDVAMLKTFLATFAFTK